MKQRRSSVRTLLASLLAAAMLVSLVPAALAAGTGETHITIIGTSDTTATSGATPMRI